MIVPRRLWWTADRRQIVEDGDPRAAFLFRGKGQMVADAEAQRIGLTRYLEVYAQQQAEQKAVAQTETEDKAVSLEETENKGLDRRGGSTRR